MLPNPDDGRPSPVDVIVAGAGYVGLAVAVALKTARPSLAVAVVDAAPAEAWRR
ncbi:MAG: 2-octaprenyl-6-methoxyphenyl hydroxylase, partial [Rhizobiaceae bacterium]